MSGRKRGRPAADIEGLVNAAVWLLHLAPDAIRVDTIADVAALLLASEEPAVRRVVGAAGYKTLCNRLAPHRVAVLVPEWHVLGTALGWAIVRDLPLIPTELIAGLPQARMFPRTFDQGLRQMLHLMQRRC